MAKTYSRSELTGGSSQALDSINGADLLDGDRALVFTSDKWAYFYILNASSGASESSPNIIAPDINAGSKRWELTNVTQKEAYLGDRRVFIQSDQPTDTDSNVGDLWVDIT